MGFEGVQRCVDGLLEAESRWREGVMSLAEFGGQAGDVAQLVVDGLASARALPESRTREVFRVELHPGDRALALLSEATAVADGTGKYELRVVLEAASTEPRVVRLDHVCTACVALGVGPRGEVCVECDGEGWEPWFGEAAMMSVRFGAPVAIRVLTAPRSSLYLPEHHRRVALARRAGLLTEGEAERPEME